MKPLIRIENLSKAYSTNQLLNDCSLALLEGRKYGVIGRNGCGKSTLCRILTRQEEADSGQIFFDPSLQLSYLEQHDPYELSETVIQFLKRNTGKPDWLCGKTAWHFRMKGDLLHQPINSLSGGFRMRVKLTAMLLQEPNFIILDEPSNYLDLSTLILLENFLQNFRGGHMVVSHDREFLKRTCDDTLEIQGGCITAYPGPIHEYLLYKEEQATTVSAYNKNIEAQRKHLQSFVDRFKAKASKAVQAQSRIKQLNRLKTIETDHPLGNVRIALPFLEEKKGTILQVQDLKIGYGHHSVASGIHLETERGKRVAILGDNGQGKTTLLKTLSGGLEPLKGEIKWGHNTSLGYYAQHVYQAISEKHDIISYLRSQAPVDITEQALLDLAGSFLFRGPETEKPVRILSGGERARLCMAGLLLGKHNVLLLDEPTNHLDFETVEALGRSLQDFKGTVFFICHDRTFVNLAATEIYEIKNGRVAHYPGSYEDYVYSIEKNVHTENQNTQENFSTKKKEKRRSTYQIRKESLSALRKLNKKITETEKEIQNIQARKTKIEKKLETDPSAWTEDLSREFNELKAQASDLENLWIKMEEQKQNQIIIDES